MQNITSCRFRRLCLEDKIRRVEVQAMTDRNLAHRKEFYEKNAMIVSQIMAECRQRDMTHQIDEALSRLEKSLIKRQYSLLPQGLGIFRQLRNVVGDSEEAILFLLDELEEKYGASLQEVSLLIKKC